jgi:hypothetical protein
MILNRLLLRMNRSAGWIRRSRIRSGWFTAPRNRTVLGTAIVNYGPDGSDGSVVIEYTPVSLRDDVIMDGRA